MAHVGLRGSSDPESVDAFVAHMVGVKRTVRAEGKAIEARAEALFAPHNRPGRHEIVGGFGDTDYHVALIGPVPVVVEFGREGFTREDGVHIGPMQGLHILGRAAGL